MSQIVRKKGKLKLIPKLEGETLEQQCKRVIEYNRGSNIDNYDDCYNSYEEQLLDEFCMHYHSYNGNLYELRYNVLLYENDVVESKLNKNGSINFDVMYCNDKTCLSKMLNRILRYYRWVE